MRDQVEAARGFAHQSHHHRLPKEKGVRGRWRLEESYFPPGRGAHYLRGRAGQPGLGRLPIPLLLLLAPPSLLLPLPPFASLSSLSLVSTQGPRGRGRGGGCTELLTALPRTGPPEVGKQCPRPGQGWRGACSGQGRCPAVAVPAQAEGALCAPLRPAPSRGLCHGLPTQ